MVEPVTIAAGLALLAALAWALTLAHFHRAGKAFPELHDGSHPGAPSAPAALSVVVAARNEAATLEACVRSILAQDYPDLELVVVDDRSDDGSPALLARLEEELGPRLRVETVEALPEGWGGQSHGLWRGVAVSRGEWLCFTDADCRFASPRALSVAWEEAQASGAELLSLLPRMDAPTLWEQVSLPLCSFVIVVSLDIVRVNDPGAPAAYANGAFFLIRRASYEALGGHEAVRHLVNDDVALARRAKQRGVALRVAANLDLCRIRMYPTLGGAWRGWTRNFYGTLQTPGRLAAALARTLGLFVLPWAALLACAGLAAWDPTWRPAAAAFALPVLISHLGLWRLFAACGVRAGASLLYPLGGVFLAGILAAALGRALRGAGTTWHGVHYADPGASPEG